MSFFFFFTSFNTLFFSSFAKVRISLYARLEQAADYIKKMEERIHKLKRKRDLVMGVDGTNREMIGGMMKGLRLPMVEVSESGSTLKVVLINGLDSNVMLSDVIAILEEEGGEVVSANKSSFADRCLHILHSQVATNSLHHFHVCG